MSSYVIIKDAPKLDYMKNFTSLPKNYGTKKYFKRADIKAIRETVYAALDDLNEKTHFTDELGKYKQVLIKPNLVFVYHNVTLDKDDYPESTDPRVFEAVVSYIKQYNENIIIVESSGKPYPTRTAFKAAGYDKIAKYYGTGLVAMELEPVVRYYLPKAEVMKEVYLPEILDKVVRGEAYYISVPKMKTNLYTGVTLGFKNAMGTIPYFLRERNHNYDIDKKLADLLYLFKPDLTVIDGIIGGEGNTPAPVDPVKVGKIVASNNSVEADRITTYMMGFDPDKNKLMIEATKRNFGDNQVQIIGDTSVTKFRPAIASLMDEKTAREFPNLMAVTGHNLPGVPEITDPNAVTPEMVLQIEQACAGGCLASVKFGTDFFNHKKSMKNEKLNVCVIEGPGIVVNGVRYWWDKNGKPYTKEDLKAIPKKKYGMGNCTLATCGDICFWKATGCCDPAKCASMITMAGGSLIPIVTPTNPWLFSTLIHIIEMLAIRAISTLKGKPCDAPSISHDDRIYEIAVAEADKDKNYVSVPMPKMGIFERVKQAVIQAYVVICALPIGLNSKYGSEGRNH
ncbi:MAG: DUF362 domain-containing protein [Clostridia bacterium]|nr:DUF362 domain-containing protein [Clostridia bacterium]MBR5976546.1 DUF362 domain-containing protein [Clostridia bacterium]MBR5991251.1 DUF362 domain-containing protein [Clostridia bacterium]MBR6479002.1 DUF362 domain-containing protein [Clostridia bacterium]MBR6512917.1 DUF362 domain-containing protein [Clostridia bacterium]